MDFQNFKQLFNLRETWRVGSREFRTGLNTIMNSASFLKDIIWDFWISCEDLREEASHKPQKYFGSGPNYAFSLCHPAFGYGYGSRHGFTITRMQLYFGISCLKFKNHFKLDRFWMVLILRKPTKNHDRSFFHPFPKLLGLDFIETFIDR